MREREDEARTGRGRGVEAEVERKLNQTGRAKFEKIYGKMFYEK
jgi:hypothetical protein